MSNKNEINHWCAVCGKGYHACDTCNKEKSFTPWRSLTDTIEHFKIFMVLKDFNNQLISKEKAKELLSDLDLSEQETFKDSAKKVLSDIFTEEIKIDEVKKIVPRTQARKNVKQNTQTKFESDKPKKSITDKE